MMRKGDGCPDGKYPVYTKCFNFPQDPLCQGKDFCHIGLCGRIPEFTDGEAVHLSGYYEKMGELEGILNVGVNMLQEGYQGAPCGEDEEEATEEQLAIASVYEGIQDRLGYIAGDATVPTCNEKKEFKAMCDEVGQFNRTFSQSMHWHAVTPECDYSDDVAILSDVGHGKQMWQIGNIEQIGCLQRKLPAGATEASTVKNFHRSKPCPPCVSIHDEKAVFTRRIYQECKDNGTRLPAGKNHTACYESEPHVFHLPVGDTAIEPSQWIQSCSVLTSVRMAKDHQNARKWKVHPDDMALMLELFEEAVQA